MESNKKALAIISFVVVMLTLLTAIISDFAIFMDAILMFVGAIIFSAIAFVFLLVCMIVSFILIFGIYLAENYGFWPLTLSFQFFQEILKDIQITPEQVATFRGFRIAFLIICVITLIISIVAQHKDEMINEKVPLKGLSKAAMIFSIMGIVVAIGMIAISSAVI